MEDTLLDILAYLIFIASLIFILILFRVIACTIANVILLVLWWGLYLLTSGFVDWRDDLVGGSFFAPWKDVFTNGWKGLLKGLFYGKGSSSGGGASTRSLTPWRRTR